MLMTSNKKVLGKGLSALLEDSNNINKNNETVGNVNLNELSLNIIEVNPFQPRADFDNEKLEELATSIKTHGVIQPVTVKDLGQGNYQLISGERRLRASKMAGKNTIPAYIKSVNDQESLEIALIENIQREDLNAIEIAENYQRLIDECELTQEALSMRVGKKRSTVSNYLRLLKLPVEIQHSIKSKVITMGHAKALINIESSSNQIRIYKRVLRESLSVRQTELLVKGINEENLTPKDKLTLTSTQQLIQDKLSAYLTSRVQVKPKKSGKGDILISYFSEAELSRILRLIHKD
ncbi:MAG TPA: ParB/RepB/Spo0J family partition protein [Bacteroidetes bacterium]|nr:ParB/RepB/Spo0J family partition protein [Bacteroidota bacterium]